MREQTIGKYLDELADRIPAPGGGAAAALQAAQAAALVAMVARYTTGEKYAEYAAEVGAILERADELRHEAVTLAEQDAAAFAGVAEAYRLPKATDDERSARSAAIADALTGAARPPAAVILAARSVVTLAGELLPIGNRSVITDVAAAADAARAAAATARLNVEVNLSGVKDDRTRQWLRDVVSTVDGVLADADRVSAAVREVIAR